MSPLSKVRWGLLSTAHINRRVIPAIRASARGELAAVASRSRDSAEAYATQWEIPQAFPSYEAMLNSDAVDAVYISLPNHLHAGWTIRALRSGKHVLCEKPFALTLDEVDQMIVASQETGKVLAEAFMYRHHPQMKIVGEWVRDGRLGEITLINSIFTYVLSGRDNVRLVPEWGGGCLWDIGVYPVSLVQYLMGGPPVWVLGDQWLGETGVDMEFAGQLNYGNGRNAHIAASFRTPFHTFAEIIGTAGRLTISRPFTGIEQSQLLFYPADGEPTPISVPPQMLYLGEIEDMHAAILDGVSPYLTLAETRDHVRTTLALYESAKKRLLVHLSR